MRFTVITEKKIMKKLTALLSIALLVVTSWFAHAQKPNAQERTERAVKRLTKELTLTPEQQEKIKIRWNKYTSDIENGYNNSKAKTKREYNKEMAALKAELDKDVADVLDEAQKVKYEALKLQKKAKVKAKKAKKAVVEKTEELTK